MASPALGNDGAGQGSQFFSAATLEPRWQTNPKKGVVLAEMAIFQVNEIMDGGRLPPVR